MVDLSFSVLDILLLTGVILLFFRVRKNGSLRELVYISILFLYSYVVLNNMKAVHDYFLEQGFDYADAIYNVFIAVFATAGLPFINFFISFYIPKLSGIANLSIGCLIALFRYLLLIYLVLTLFPNLYDISLFANSFVINVMLSYVENIYIYLLS
ncbi:hypothetical protein M9B40_03905 [SAR86 cluster bacterium]|jgi:hypothetical protein|uniref:Uncharacterized protein n=1 Tax=SAR86 cluster bacterium TaxID=2030880 RepID=A0A9Q8U0A1_9GAMM|nr:hypothetical protein M9B40_03905 [SAR86 cluster bacterium]|tara:strand:- start:1834 stop:2298 length:465 start_codon:yes stop_codon:yes gene_type:complete